MSLQLTHPGDRVTRSTEYTCVHAYAYIHIRMHMRAYVLLRSLNRPDDDDEVVMMMMMMMMMLMMTMRSW